MSDAEQEELEHYLGDGLYASFDGHQVKLLAPRSGGDYKVYLKPETYRALVEFVKGLERWP